MRYRSLGLVVIVSILVALTAARVRAAEPSVSGGPWTKADFPKPCLTLSFRPVTPARHLDGGVEERIEAVLRSAAGTEVTAPFPYAWTYPDDGRSDPWSSDRSRERRDVQLQTPPPGADVDRYPIVIRELLRRMDAQGTVRLPGCTP